jgi:predicted Zn-dependent protease
MITKNDFYQLADAFFQKLNSNEDVAISLSTEDTIFMRFTKSKVRQMGEVEQSDLQIQLSCEEKSIVSSFSLQGNLEQMLKRAGEELNMLRAEIKALPVDPHYTPIMAGESTEDYLQGELLSNEEITETILAPLADVDAAGIYCSGKVARASANSKGQRHWFENDSFFVDYSFYSAKQQAVKGGYAGRIFNRQQYLDEIKDKKELLAKVSLDAKKIKPGKYRAYLAPAAVAEILATMSWRGFSYSGLKQGQSPLKDLEAGTNLDSKVHLHEDFSLGFSPRFNNQGEVAMEKLTLFENGALVNTLVSSRSAKEYDTESNYATGQEMPRSLILDPGKLNESDVLKELGTGLYISNLHYLNWSDLQKGRMTGMTRFACFWVEDGKIVSPIEDLRFDESFYHFFGDGLVELTDQSHVFPEIGTYEQRSVGAMKTPGLLVDDFSFTL